MISKSWNAQNPNEWPHDLPIPLSDAVWCSRVGFSNDAVLWPQGPTKPPAHSGTSSCSLKLQVGMQLLHVTSIMSFASKNRKDYHPACGNVLLFEWEIIIASSQGTVPGPNEVRLVSWCKCHMTCAFHQYYLAYRGKVCRETCCLVQPDWPNWRIKPRIQNPLLFLSLTDLIFE